MRDTGKPVAPPPLMSPLPDDVVIGVIISQAHLGFLGVMTMVSRRWKLLCADRILHIQQVRLRRRRQSQRKREFLTFCARAEFGGSAAHRLH